MKIASHNAPNQFESPTSRKEREKWGTLRFITEKWATRQAGNPNWLPGGNQRTILSYKGSMQLITNNRETPALLFLAALACLFAPTIMSLFAAEPTQKPIELTKVDLFSQPEWQKAPVAVDGFALGMTRSEARRLAETHGLTLALGSAPQSAEERESVCQQAMCSVRQRNGNYIGVDLYFDRAGHTSRIAIEFSQAMDLEVQRANVARRFKGLTYRLFNDYSDSLRQRVLGPAEGEERQVPTIKFISYKYLSAGLIVTTAIDTQSKETYDIEVDFISH
jgi:hypothetical protein